MILYAAIFAICISFGANCCVSVSVLSSNRYVAVFTCCEKNKAAAVVVSVESLLVSKDCVASCAFILCSSKSYSAS